MSVSAPPRGFRLEPLKDQSREGFACGEPSLDDYIRRQAGQDAKRHLAVVFLLIEESSGTLAGYYTLSATNIVPSALPAAIRKRLPRYDAFPATLLGRLAVDERQKGKGLGKWLLMDACVRSLVSSGEVASLAVVVDALHGTAQQFYESFGFQTLESSGRRLFLPMQTIARLLDA